MSQVQAGGWVHFSDLGTQAERAVASLGTLFHSEWQATVQEGGAETCSSSQGLVLELVQCCFCPYSTG